MKNNTPVTIPSNGNGLSKKQKQFYQKCLSINQEEYRSFSYLDFTEISKVNFRQMILRLKRRNLIEVVTRSKPNFYKIVGTHLPSEGHSVTFRPMGGGSALLEILESLKDQPPMIHDIKIQFESSLHEKLREKGFSMNPSNKSITVNAIPVKDRRLVIKALVYPKTTQIDVACSINPIIYDYNSLQSFFENLVNVSVYLTGLSGTELPYVKNWVITHYHFNRDGKFSVNGSNFHITWEEFSSGLIRFYSKKISGDEIVRIEQIRTPKITLGQAMIEAVK